MSDMRTVIEPKSDQLNTDDLIGGPRTIRVRDVKILPSGEQRVSVYFDGDNGKPWKPCKSMCRVLVEAWGPDANAYVGRSVTLYKDAKVKWGGLEVGGIRVSHMSHLERDMVMALTETRGKRTPYLVKVLTVQAEKPSEKSPKLLAMVDKLLSDIDSCTSVEQLVAYLGTDDVRRQTNWLKKQEPRHSELVEKAIAEKGQSLRGNNG